MQKMPEEILKYTEIDDRTMGRVMKKDTPQEIIDKAIEWEKDFYSKTSRRTIVDLDIDENSIEFIFDKNRT